MDDSMEKKIENWFTYHAPRPGQPELYAAIRDAGKALALTIAANTPSCADQTVAIRKVREAVMNANAAIACDGK
ncbi:MAG: hypothetical protein V1755_14060 [Chloroflexota bacterium]